MKIDKEKKDLLTVKETAKYMCVSISCIYSQIYNGTIPVLRVGSTYRIKKAWVQKYLKEGGR